MFFFNIHAIYLLELTKTQQFYVMNDLLITGQVIHDVVVVKRINIILREAADVYKTIIVCCISQSLQVARQ